MTEKNLDIITRITVEIHKDDAFKEKLGTGVLYSNRLLSGLVYVLTAKHCLAGVKEKDKVSLRVYNPDSGNYEYITPVNQTILRHMVDDAGIIIFNYRELKGIYPKLPSVFVVDKYVATGDFLIKDLKTVTKLKWARKEELSAGEKWLSEQKGKGLLVLAGHGDCFELDNYDLNKIY